MARPRSRSSTSMGAPAGSTPSCFPRNIRKTSVWTGSAMTFGTERIPVTTIEHLVNKHFDLSPLEIIRELELRRPIYKQTAAYGHFGRSDLDLPWERTDKADLLASDAGVQRLQVVESQDG